MPIFRGLKGKIKRTSFYYRWQLALFWLTTLRTWYVRSALKEVMRKRLALGAVVLDAGCGLGQDSHYLARKYPWIEVVAQDLDKTQLNDFGHFLRRTGIRNIRLSQGDLSDRKYEGEFDLILCSSVIQYVPDEEGLLERFQYALKGRGILILYVPLERAYGHFSLVRALGDKTASAHFPQLRVYSAKELAEKVASKGFAVEKLAIIHGWFGSLAYEIVLYFRKMRFFGLSLFYPYVVFLHPFVLLLMLIDFLRTNERGNAALLVAMKSESSIPSIDKEDCV